MTDDQAGEQDGAPRPAQHRPVVIIGAGPVGVTAALLLARHGIRSVIFERHRDVYPLPRAVVADDEVRRIFQAVGIGEQFDAITRPAKGLRLLDARHRMIAEFPRSLLGHHGYPQVNMFDQPELERLLRDALARRPECELRSGVEVVGVDQDADGPVRVAVRHSEGGAQEYVWADAVLGCDGAGSLTRDAIGAAWEDLRFEERWAVVDVRTRARVRCWEGVDQVCDPRQPATFMRVGEDRYRWEFRVTDGEHSDGHDGRERLRDLVAPWVDFSSGDDLEVIRQAQYTFRARIADRWRRGRVFLLGDAAHLTPPFVGQGLCTGIRDAHNLAWKLARVLKHGTDERLLDTYESERKRHARHVIRIAVTTGWAMTGGQDRAARWRRALVGTAARIPGLTAAVSRDLTPALPPGPLVRRRTRPGRKLTGTFCPQPWLDMDGRPTRFDDTLENSFVLLTAVAPTPSLEATAEALGARILPVRGIGDDGTLAAWMRKGRADAVLLRPDRIVLDVVRTGSDRFMSTTTWAPLLCAAPPPAQTDQPASASLFRSSPR